MIIKKYLQFMNERVERKGTYEFGCVLLELDLPGWKKIISIIDPEDLYEPNDGRHGIETDPHVTLKFGLESSVTLEQVREILEKNPLTEKIHVEKIDLFRNEQFDVVKFKVTPSKQLIKINQELSQLPNQDKFPNYNPHITIGYVKPGCGDKYIQDNFDGWATPYKIIYSMPNGNKFYL
jgi:2'-5' RNA ligase